MATTEVGAGHARPLRLAVIGAGQFGKNHCRAVHESPRAQLCAVVDTDTARAAELAALYGAEALADAAQLAGKVDAAIVAVPTTVHEEIGGMLAASGIDILVEKPITPDLASAGRLIEAAERHGRILQVGHIERFNPAVVELERRATLPLFFEIHRMNLFSPRSLDVDVVLDLMIHDVDIVLALARAEPVEIRAAGISILSPKVDIANVRLQFPNGCVANLTASRVSTDTGPETAPVSAAPISFPGLRAAGPGGFLGGRGPPDRLRTGARNQGRAPETAARSLPGLRGNAKFAENFRPRRASKLRGGACDS